MSSEPKWTKGPWVYCEQTNCVVVAEAEDGGDIICGAPDGFYSYQRWPANRALIAAAPDLYEALAAICDDLEIGDETSAEQVARHAGRAALSKANPDIGRDRI